MLEDYTIEVTEFSEMVEEDFASDIWGDQETLSEAGDIV